LPDVVRLDRCAFHSPSDAWVVALPGQLPQSLRPSQLAVSLSWSWPGLTRPSTSLTAARREIVMPGTRPGMTSLGTVGTLNLSPRCQRRLSCSRPRPLEGRIMRRREAGRGAEPLGDLRKIALGQRRGSARAHYEALPGADDCLSRRRKARSRGTKTGRKDRSGALTAKARPAPTNLPRLARREAPARLRTRSHRICAFRRAIPPHQGEFSKLRTLRRVAARSAHVYSIVVPANAGVQ
jgi:hypothetical protein